MQTNITMDQIRNLIIQDADDLVEELESHKRYRGGIDNLDARKQIASILNLMEGYTNLVNKNDHYKGSGLKPFYEPQTDNTFIYGIGHEEFYTFDVNEALKKIKDVLKEEPHDENSRKAVLRDFNNYSIECCKLIKKECWDIYNKTGFDVRPPLAAQQVENDFSGKFYRSIAFSSAYVKNLLNDNHVYEHDSRDDEFTLLLSAKIIDDTAEKYAYIDRDYPASTYDDRQIVQNLLKTAIKDDNLGLKSQSALEKTRIYDYYIERQSLIDELRIYAYEVPNFYEPIPGYEKEYEKAKEIAQRNVPANCRVGTQSLTRGGRINNPQDILNEIQSRYAIGLRRYASVLQAAGNSYDTSFTENIPTAEERESALIGMLKERRYSHLTEEERRPYIEADVLQYTGSDIYKEYRALCDAVDKCDYFNDEEDLDDANYDWRDWQNLDAAKDGEYDFMMYGVPAFEVYVAHHDEIISKLPGDVAYELALDKNAQKSIMENHKIGQLIKNRNEAIDILSDAIKETVTVYTRDGMTTPSKTQAETIFIKSNHGIVADIYHAVGFGEEKDCVDINTQGKDDLWRAATAPDFYKDVTDAMLYKATTYINKGPYPETAEKLKAIQTEILDKYRDENGVIDGDNLLALTDDHPVIYAIESDSIPQYKEYVHYKDHYEHDITMNQFIDDYVNCKTMEYVIENGHVEGKPIDTQYLTLSINDPIIDVPANAKSADLAEMLEKAYEISGNDGCKIGCDPTPEGVVTYINAVYDIFKNKEEFQTQNYDGPELDNIIEDINYVQDVADTEVAMQALAQERSDQEQDIEKNIDQDRDEKETSDEHGDI